MGLLLWNWVLLGGWALGGVSFVLRGFGASFHVCCFEGFFLPLWYTK